MKILIISDSHGNDSAVASAIYKECPDAIIHLGDGCTDIPESLDFPCYQVCGNCDSFTCNLPNKQIIELEGVRIFMTHGHLYNVKTTMSSIYLAALEANADIALFGHTHMPFTDINPQNPALFNPGSIRRPPHSYGTLVVKDGKFNLRHRSLL